ncbi:hypothetical protein [Leifsonia naganoensis]|uniref:Uncharacterized protein n=1 Tax=Leifsonia naganoensis TaxID=150025 RepID=A0A853DLY6_9MICO|nr:hypothetical protein [Leifsonia naganoensis]NYK10086.1 hypothetical protein [Leifsonia naganoensis]
MTTSTLHLPEYGLVTCVVETSTHPSTGSRLVVVRSILGPDNRAVPPHLWVRAEKTLRDRLS